MCIIHIMNYVTKDNIMLPEQITLRDYFAGLFMQAFVRAARTRNDNDWIEAQIREQQDAVPLEKFGPLPKKRRMGHNIIDAHLSYEIADAMLAAREKNKCCEI